MKFFKTQANRAALRYEITLQEFNRVTGEKYPYLQTEGTKEKRYGICPSCLNPIQLRAMASKERKPYGCHTGKDVMGLREWKYCKYQNCPYASNRRAPSDDYDPYEIDEDVVELYELLKSQFDRVVYILSKSFDIRCSEKFWRDALTLFLGSRGYCYPWLTEANLPYIFAYKGMQQQNLYRQKVKVNSDLYKALSKVPNVALNILPGENYAVIDHKGEFLDLHFRLHNHTQKAESGEILKESIHFCIDDFGTKEIKTIFETKVTFDETYFQNLINKPEGDAKRQQYLLDIANELMKPLELTSKS